MENSTRKVVLVGEGMV
nr:L-lactate dehydrogenase homolog {N-terminal} [Spiroplasma melliferum, A56, Peptide Partial, 16 aa] [Spiroplasma melliferum]